jgi:hypothetical protein
MLCFDLYLRRFTAHDAGAAAIEFAILVPVFLLFVCGMMAYGIYFGAAHSIQQIAADAARTAVAGLNTGERNRLVAQFISNNAGRYVLIDRDALPTTLATIQTTPTSTWSPFTTTLRACRYGTSTCRCRSPTISSPILPASGGAGSEGWASRCCWQEGAGRFGSSVAISVARWPCCLPERCCSARASVPWPSMRARSISNGGQRSRASIWPPSPRRWVSQMPPRSPCRGWGPGS